MLSGQDSVGERDSGAGRGAGGEAGQSLQPRHAEGCDDGDRGGGGGEQQQQQRRKQRPPLLHLTAASSQGRLSTGLPAPRRTPHARNQNSQVLL